MTRAKALTFIGNRIKGQLKRVSWEQRFAWLDTWEGYEKAPDIYSMMTTKQIYKMIKVEPHDYKSQPILRKFFNLPKHFYPPTAPLWYDTGTL